MEGWHLDKRVNLSNLIAIVSVTVGLIVWGLSLQERVAVNETEITQMKDQDVIMRQEIKALNIQILNKLDDMTDKLYDHQKEHNGNGG